MFIRQHKLWNDAQLRIATVTGFSWYQSNRWSQLLLHNCFL